MSKIWQFLITGIFVLSLGSLCVENLTIFDYGHFCPKRGVPQTPTLRIPLKLQPKPQVLGFFDISLAILFWFQNHNPTGDFLNPEIF